MHPLDLLREWLKQLDEVTLCELLDLNAEDLIEAFPRKIAQRRAYLEKEMELVEPRLEGEGDRIREIDLSKPAWEEYSTGYYGEDEDDN